MPKFCNKSYAFNKCNKICLHCVEASFKLQNCRCQLFRILSALKHQTRETSLRVNGFDDNDKREDSELGHHLCDWEIPADSV